MKQGEMESRTLASVVNLVDIRDLLSLPELKKHCISKECLQYFQKDSKEQTCAEVGIAAP